MATNAALQIIINADVAELRQKLGQAEASMASLRANGSKDAATLSEALTRADSAGTFSKSRAGVESISKQLQGLQTWWFAFHAASNVAPLIQGAFAVADQYTSLTSRLKLATTSQKEYNEAYAGLRKIAKDNGSDFGAQVQLYNRISGAVRNMQGSTSDALKVTEAVALSMRLSGASATEAAAATMQFAQALGSGRLGGEEFNSVNEQSPALLEAIAKGMGVQKEQLKGMAEQGKLTSDVVGNALIKQFDNLKDKAAQMPMTVGQSFTELRNAMMEYVGMSDKASGSSSKMANTVKVLADNFVALADTAKVVAGVMLAIWGGKMASSAVASTIEFVQVSIAKRAALMAELEATVAATAAKAEYAAMQLRASSANGASIAGMTQHIAVQNAATAATSAHTAAQARLASAQGMGAVTTSLTSILGFLGGPVGIIATLALAASAWSLFGKSSADAATESEKSAKRIKDATAALQTRVEKRKADAAAGVAIDRPELAYDILLAEKKANDALAVYQKSREDLAKVEKQYGINSRPALDARKSSAADKNKLDQERATFDQLIAAKKQFNTTSEELDAARAKQSDVNAANQGKAVTTPLQAVAKSLEALRGVNKTEVSIGEEHKKNLLDIELGFNAAIVKARKEGDLKRIGELEKEQKNMKAQENKRFNSEIKSLNTTPGSVTTSTDFQMAKAKAEAELALKKDALAFLQQLDDSAYQAGLLGLQDYFAKRLARTQEGLGLEKKALDAELKAAQVAQTKKGIDANEREQAKVKEVEIKGRLAKNAQDVLQAEQLKNIDLLKAQTTYGNESLNLLADQLEREGKLVEAAAARLPARYREALEKADANKDTARRKMIEGAIGNDISQASLKEANQNANLGRLPAQGREQFLNAQANAGLISQVALQKELKALRAEQVPVVEAQIASLIAIKDKAGDATGSITTQINGLQAELVRLKAPTEQLGIVIENSFAKNLETAFAGLMTGTKTFQQAFADMAKSIIADIAQIEAKKLATSLSSSLFGGGAGGAGGSSSIGSTIGNWIGSVFKFADGGQVSGPGGSRTDSIPAMLSNGEHVIDARTVGHFGHTFFDALRAVGNNRLSAKAPNPHGFKFADGGAVAAMPVQGGNGRPITISQSFIVQGSTDQRSQSQISSAAYSGAQRALKRNG